MTGLRTSPLPLTLCSFAILLSACGENSTTSTNATSSAGNTSPSSEPWFQDESSARGVEFTLSTEMNPEPWLPEIVAGGAAVLDVDQDGWMDLYLVQASGEGGNRLLRNTGEGAFEDITAGSGADDNSGYGMGAATGDYDNDGDLDIHIANVGANTLLRNDGNGRFTDVTAEAGVGHEGLGASAVFFDGDNDGDLDLMVTNYVLWSPEKEMVCRSRNGERSYCNPANYNAPSPDVLYRNNGDGTFSDVSTDSGIGGKTGNGLGVVARDVNADGLIDLFVANDANPDRLWINLGNLTFEDQAIQLGCDRDFSGKPKAGMGVLGEDFDDDGDIDLFVCNLINETNSFFSNTDGRFIDVTTRSGLGGISRRFTRFGLGFQDFDNDGYRDLYEANGRVSPQAEPIHDEEDHYAEPNLLHRGNAEGRFVPVEPTGGVEGLVPRTSRGAVVVDVNNDGGVDLLVINKDAPSRLLMNTAHEKGNWLIVDVRNASGAPALGATLRAHVGDRILTRPVHTDGSYLCSRDPRVHLGIGDATSVDRLEIAWPNGETRVIEDVRPGQVIRIEPEAAG
ncbi:MAG: CRTAC1 family protein [Phycisphaerales bacterium]|nr:CRTAC1 family protein [Phycisphaerales bacterium]